MNKIEEIQKQELEAVEYIEKRVKPLAEPKEGLLGTQGFWQEMVLNYLKQQALNFVASSLVHLRKQAVSHLVDLADWLLEQLENYLINLYQKADQEEKQIFLNKIQTTFPNSRLLSKLEEVDNGWK